MSERATKASMAYYENCKVTFGQYTRDCDFRSRLLKHQVATSLVTGTDKTAIAVETPARLTTSCEKGIGCVSGAPFG